MNSVDNVVVKSDLLKLMCILFRMHYPDEPLCRQ